MVRKYEQPNTKNTDLPKNFIVWRLRNITSCPRFLPRRSSPANPFRFRFDSVVCSIFVFIFESVLNRTLDHFSVAYKLQNLYSKI